MRLLRKVIGVQKVIYVCLDDTELIFATKYAGETLDSLLVKGQLSIEQLMKVFRQLAVVLQQVHAEGLTHSDVKMENVCVNLNYGMVRTTLIDLSLTQEPGAVYRFDPSLSTHIAPEVAMTGTSAAADIYGLANIILRVD